MSRTQTLTAAAVLLGLCGSAFAQIAVDADLGTLLGGTTTNITDPGDDGSIAGNSEAYNTPNDGAATAYRTYIAKEWVYQFTITEDSTISIFNNLSDLVADRDYFLANGLNVALETLDTGDWLTAQDSLDFIDGDFGVPGETFEGGPYPAGTYYLIIDEFTGGDGSLAPGAGGIFDVDLIIETFVPPSEPTVFTDLGIIGDSGSVTSFELCGSDFDTEMAVYDANGNLIANNDDFCGLQSGLDLGLQPGTYWAAVAGFNTTFDNGWVASGSGRDFGISSGSFGSAPIADAVDPDVVNYYRFEIEMGTVTPPTAIDLGDVATTADTFSIDSFGSDFDTELGLWDSSGTLLANNDDAGGVLQSEIAGLNLAEGTYYFSISPFNTDFGDLFGASTSSTTVGLAAGQVNGTLWDTAINGEVVFYSFNVTSDGGGSCPGDVADDFGFPGGDNQVSFGDFLFALGILGPCPGGTPGCDFDIADDFGFAGGDGQVSFGDFLFALGILGPCP